MKATELRIGNYIEKSLKSGNGRKLYNRLTITDFNHIYENDGSFNYEPIPLTEEIFLKCGFKKDTKGVLVLNKNIYSLILWGGEVSIYLKIDESVLSIEIHYLHQLQNLYFALTGKELEVNL